MLKIIFILEISSFISEIIIILKIYQIFKYQKNKTCAISTHIGEEKFCLKTHLILKISNLITFIAPRHTHRIKNIIKLCKNTN